MRGFIFDLDGTLVDSAYHHALAWHQALREARVEVPAASVHRLIGMSGSLLALTLAREQDQALTPARLKTLEQRHAKIFAAYAPQCRPLPGARALLERLADAKIPHGIATSGKRADIETALRTLKLPRRTRIVDGSRVKSAKPEPDLILACQRAIRVPPRDCVMVGDAIWDIHAARRSGVAAIGVLTGGFGEQELHNAGAMRVYPDLVALGHRLTELGLTI